MTAFGASVVVQAELMTENSSVGAEQAVLGQGGKITTVRIGDLSHSLSSRVSNIGPGITHTPISAS